MQTVYVLADNDSRIRYVGRTKSPAKRMTEHRAKSAAPSVRGWFDDLRSRGEQPRMLCIGATEDDATAMQWEQWFIRSCLALGADLLNKTGRLVGPRTDGARMLETHIRAAHHSIPSFCATHGLGRIAVQRVLRGERPANVSVDFALRVREATKGLIPVEAWRSETARKVRG